MSGITREFSASVPCAGLFINFVPVFALVLAFFILKEPVTPSLLIGTILVISGVYLTGLGSRRA